MASTYYTIVFESKAYVPTVRTLLYAPWVLPVYVAGVSYIPGVYV